MTISRNLAIALAVGFVGAVIGLAMLLAFVFPAGSGDGTVPQAAAVQPVDAGESRVAPDDAADQPRRIGREEAGRIAAVHVGGTVDDVDREFFDVGVAWDVDVYGPDGDYTVYLSAFGEVVRVEGPW